MSNKILLACFSVVMTSAVVSADTFTFSFTGGAITSSGTITATEVDSNTSGATANGTFEVTGISGMFKDTSDGISGNISGLVAPISYVTPATSTNSKPVSFTSNGLSYDDLFFPLGNSPNDCPGYPFSGGDFDSLGVAFTIAGNDGKAYIGEFFSNGVIPNVGLLSAAVDGSSTQVLNDPNQGSETLPQGVIGSFTATAPEPSAGLLVGAGLLAAAVLRRRVAGSR